MPDREGNEEHIAVLIELVDGGTMMEAEIIAHCAEIMPKYMVACHIRIVDGLLTPTGKSEIQAASIVAERIGLNAATTPSWAQAPRIPVGSFG